MKKTATFFYLIFYCLFSIGQPKNDFRCILQNYSVAEGLSQGMINSILQDSYGFIWFATKDGVNRFDGKKFFVYKHNSSDKNSLPDNYVNVIAEDSKKHLWMGTSTKGLIFFDREKEQFHFFNSTTSSENFNQVFSIAEAQNDMLIIRTDIGFCSVNVSNLEKIKIEKIKKFLGGEIFSVSLKKIFHLSPSEIFSIDKNQKLSSFISKKIFEEKKIQDAFVSIKEDFTQKKLFIFCKHSLIEYNYSNKQFEFLFQSKQQIFNEEPICKSSSNRIWFTFHGKLAVMNLPDTTIKLVKTEEQNIDISSISFNRIVEDRSGNIWIGTKGYGILKFNPNSKRFEKFDNGSISSISENHLSEIMICKTNAEKVCIYDIQKKEIVQSLPENITPAMHSGIVESVMEQWKNIYWICKGKIIRYDAIKKTSTFFSTKNDFNFPVFMDAKRQIWWSSDSKLCKFDSAKNIVREYNYPISISNSPYKFIEHYFFDNAQTLWLATTKGLLHFNPENENWQQFKNNPADSNSISTDIIFSICPDPNEPEKYLWLGTNGGGLNRFEKQTGKALRFNAEKNNLPNDVVYGVLSDDENNLWLSTNNGIARFNIQTHQVKKYSISDGLQSNEFNRYAFCKSKSGDLFFGGVNGVNFFKPSAIKDNLFAPPTLITDCKINNKSVTIQENSVLKKPIYLTSEMILPNSANVISFDFISTDFTSPEKNKYQYKLEGFDADWVSAANNQSATYTNLDPGDYIFKVKSTNYDGVWCANSTNISIKILPPWYSTWWFRLLMLLSFGGIIYSIYRFRINQTIELHNIRNRIASDLHDEIGSTLSSISLYGEVAQNMVKETTPEATNLLAHINNSTHQMMDAMSDIVWALNSKNDRFDNIINKMRAFAIERLEPLHCKLEMQIEEGVHHHELNMQQRKNVYLIFKETINNAAKYSNATIVFVNIKIKNNHFLLSIKDNGNGFDTGIEHNGNGLDNIKKRVKELHGNMQIISKIGSGTTLELSFKI
jgi:ligand-binding sensor domain-containing protein/two-component sensor histidine kinase